MAPAPCNQWFLPPATSGSRCIKADSRTGHQAIKGASRQRPRFLQGRSASLITIFRASFGVYTQFSLFLAHQCGRNSVVVSPQARSPVEALTKTSGSSSVVEHQLPKLRVAGSTPVSRSERGSCLSFFLRC